MLEPEEPLRTGVRAFYAGMTALLDALASHAPPEKVIRFDWPDGVRVDGGLVGGGRLAWPARSRLDAPPNWLVFGAMIRTVSLSGEEPGLRPLSAALEEEGFADLGAGRIVESFCRHLMTRLDAWNEAGFGEIARDYLLRLRLEETGRAVIEDDGDLVLTSTRAGAVERRALRPLLRQPPSWLDPKTRGPRW